MGKYSIIQEDLTRCYFCESTKNIHIHHVFHGTANRKLSEKYHLIVALCATHHNMSNYSVHHNRGMDLMLKSVGQEAFTKHFGTRDDFRKIFGKIYK